jgi:hypothetical protein
MLQQLQALHQQLQLLTLLVVLLVVCHINQALALQQ